MPRPADLVERFVDIVFNEFDIHILEIDMKHINHGSKGNRKSNLDVSEVVNITVAFLNNSKMDYDEEKKFGNESCQYYSLENIYKEKKYRLVFCLCSDQLDRLGIITLYRK